MTDLEAKVGNGRIQIWEPPPCIGDEKPIPSKNPPKGADENSKVNGRTNGFSGSGSGLRLGFGPGVGLGIGLGFVFAGLLVPALRLWWGEAGE